VSREREPLSPSARKRGEAVRAFFAIALGEPLRGEVAALARALAARPNGDGVRWVAPENYHLTLRFLGNVATEELPALCARAGAALAPAEPFELRLGAPSAFPTPRRPRVVALSAEPAATLGDLAARLESAVVACGLAPEARDYAAHLTLGRVRARRLPALEAPAPTAGLAVAAVELFRSDLAPAGSRYTPLAALALGAASARSASTPLPTRN
jgi:2'-5' RNA ligase